MKRQEAKAVARLSRKRRAANPPARRVAPGMGQPERERERAAWKDFVAWASAPIGHSGQRREADQAGIDTATEPGESPKETML